MFRVFSHIFLFPFSPQPFVLPPLRRYRTLGPCFHTALVFTHHPRLLLLCRTYYFLQYPFFGILLGAISSGLCKYTSSSFTAHNGFELQSIRLSHLHVHFKCMRKTRKYCLLMEFHFLLNHPVYLKHLCNSLSEGF